MSTTFPLSKVERAKTPLEMPERIPPKLLGRPIEAWGLSHGKFRPCSGHGLLEAVSLAFADHYPLILTPDAVWLAIAQGFAAHVRKNAERLRGRFVRTEGKERMSVRRDDFVRGSPANPWPEVFSAFSDVIAERIGRQRDLVVCDFSTTGPCERAASEIVLMGAMERYFEYEVMTLCGIPEITLEGTVEDWRSIRRRTAALAEYELEWWISGLAPVLDKIVDTAEGQVDAPFWRSLFKLNDASGGPYVTGWINVLFPYISTGRSGGVEINKAVATWSEGLEARFGGGPKESRVPCGLSGIPFEWTFIGGQLPMDLLGGFVGVAQDATTLALRPAIGWAVRESAPDLARD